MPQPSLPPLRSILKNGTQYRFKETQSTPESSRPPRTGSRHYIYPGRKHDWTAPLKKSDALMSGMSRAEEPANESSPESFYQRKNNSPRYYISDQKSTPSSDGRTESTSTSESAWRVKSAPEITYPRLLISDKTSPSEPDNGKISYPTLPALSVHDNHGTSQAFVRFATENANEAGGN